MLDAIWATPLFCEPKTIHPIIEERLLLACALLVVGKVDAFGMTVVEVDLESGHTNAAADFAEASFNRLCFAPGIRSEGFYRVPLVLWKLLALILRSVDLINPFKPLAIR